MTIILDSKDFCKDHTCVALGNFDGVHRGHKAIISKAVECALAEGLTSCVYTFRTHTSNILGRPKMLLTDTDEKNELISKLNCDLIYLDDFETVRYMLPADFCQKILYDKLKARYVFCGEDYRFGYNGEGDVSLLEAELSKLDIKLEVIPFLHTDNSEVISSTMIREYISDGNVDSACKLLGSPYRISGIVMHGKQLGRKLGFPTLNIPIPADKIIPKFGVYVSTCLLDGTWYEGISNIGIRPTTDSQTNTKDIINCETYLFDYNGDAYGKKIIVKFWKMIRPEMKFSTIEELKERISIDRNTAIKCFKEIRPEFM